MVKRYRCMPGDFDTRAVLLGQRIEESWESPVKALWQSNKRASEKRSRQNSAPLIGIGKNRIFSRSVRSHFQF